MDDVASVEQRREAQSPPAPAAPSGKPPLTVA
jgi:hypothetical protein